MEVVWGLSSSSWCDLRSDLGRGSCMQKDACHLFDEMAAEEWRSPSRVLDVTVHHVYYPITDKVLWDVFSPFGAVEHVHVFGGAVPISAQIVFQSRYDAAEAFGELHGRNIYDGCCQMAIKWALFHEPDVPKGTKDGDTVAQLSSVHFSSTASIATLDGLVSKRLDREATVGGNMVVDPTTEAVDIAMSSKHRINTRAMDNITDAMDYAMKSASSTLLQASPTSIKAITNVDTVSAISLDSDTIAIDAAIDALAKCLTDGSSIDIRVLLSPHTANDVPTSSPLSMFLSNLTPSIATSQLLSLAHVSLGVHYLFNALPTNHRIVLNVTVKLSRDHLLDVLSYISMFSAHEKSLVALGMSLEMWVEQHPRQPTAPLEPADGGDDLQPTLSLSFITTHDITTGECYSFYIKPAWTPVRPLWRLPDGNNVLTNKPLLDTNALHGSIIIFNDGLLTCTQIQILSHSGGQVKCSTWKLVLALPYLITHALTHIWQVQLTGDIFGPHSLIMLIQYYYAQLWTLSMVFLGLTVSQSSNHTIYQILTSVGTLEWVNCGNYLAWIFGLLMPWNPGIAVLLCLISVRTISALIMGYVTCALDGFC